MLLVSTGRGREETRPGAETGLGLPIGTASFRYQINTVAVQNSKKPIDGNVTNRKTTI